MNTLDKYDVYFGIEGYTKQLREKMIKENSSQASPASFLDKFYELIKFDESRASFKKIILETFRQMAEVTVGKKLIKRFIQEQISLELREDADTKTKGEIVCDTSFVSYYFSLDDAGKIILVEQTLAAYLFRKMMHLSQDQTHVSESENGFLLAKNLPLNISNHKGPKIPIKKNLGFSDTFLSLERLSLERAKEYILEKKNLIQKKQRCYFSSDDKQKIYGKKVFPITAACYFGSYELVFHLLELGASLLVKDEFGGPLQACFQAYDFILAKELCATADLCEEEDILEALISSLSTNQSEPETMVGLDSFLELLETSEKCELFESLLSKNKPFKFLSYLIRALPTKSRIVKNIDPRIDALLGVYIKYLILPRKIPLDYEYAIFFVEFLNTIVFTQNALNAAIYSEELENKWILNALNKKFLKHPIDIERLDKLDFENIFSKTHLA